MKRTFIGAASLLMSLALSAAEVGTEDVEFVAKGWVLDNAAAFGQLGAFQSVKAERDASGQVLWYWVFMEEGALVVAPDDEIEPVIAMLPRCDGPLPENHPMRALLLGDLTRRVALAKAQQTSGTGGRTFQAAPPPKSATAAKWQRLINRGNPRPSFQSASHVVDSPAMIVKWLDGWNDKDDQITCWTQESPFNNYTPLGETPFGLMPCVVGCVATAGSAVLHYFRVPGCESNLVGSCTVNGMATNLYTKGGTYDWSLFEGEDAPVPDELVARVSLDVGLLSHMNYTALESGAFGFDLATALRKHFGLASARYVNQNGPNGGNTTSIMSDYYPDLVYNQIRAGSPVLFGISSTKVSGVGHEVVACGYGIDTDNTDYTYIFCGWAGLGDAWYSLPFIDTKATAGGSNAAYDTIGEMIVSLSTNACYVPLVGRIVDTEGKPVTEPLTLSDGTRVQPDANGYWGVRIDPGMSAKVIYDPVGDPHPFTVGPIAATPKTFKENGTEDAVAAGELAAALPDAMEIVVKRELIGNKLAVVADYETAVREALAKGKLLYVFGGADTVQVEALKNDFRANSNETFFSECVFWQVDANRYSSLGNSSFFAGLADPRTLDPYAPWSAANGQWTEGLDAWKSTSRKPKSGGLTLTGPAVVNAAEAGSQQYVLTVVYADGVTKTLNAALVDWSVSPADKASVALGYLTPVPGATGALTVKADVSALFGASGLSVSLSVTLTEGPCRIIGGCRTNTCIVAVDDDPNVLKRAQEIAQGDASNRGLITPAFNKTGFDPFMEEVQAGTLLHLEMQASRTFDKDYVLRCVGLEVTADGQVVTNVTFDADAESKTVSCDYEARGAVTRVGWQWKTDKYYVKLDSDERAKLDCGTGYYPAGSNLVVNVTPGTDVKANKDWVAIWRGCSRAEAGVSNATLKVDAIRDVWATVANVSNNVPVASTNGLVVAKGYRIELIEVKEGNPDWDEPTKYTIRVVYGDPLKEVDPPTAVMGLVYNGNQQTGVVASTGFTLTGNVGTNAGSYTAIATLDDDYAWTGGGVTDMTINWTIAKATYDMSHVVFTNVTYVCDGTSKSNLVDTATLPKGVRVVSYLNNGQTAVGAYTVTAKFAGDAANYEPIADKTAKLTIVADPGPGPGPGPGPEPTPETVSPDPIAFASIEKIDGKWVLVATNAKQWCEYSLWGGTTLKTNEWTEPVVDWAKWEKPDGPITNRVTVTDDAQWFWILRARPGEKPVE